MADELSYFALLGVDEDVNQEELEARYQELADLFASPAIPAHLKEWARRQAALVDEAYAVLSDSERRAAIRREREAPAAAPAAQAAGEPDQAQPPPAADAEPAEERPERAKPRARAERVSPPPPGISDALLGRRLQPLIVGVLLGLVVLGAILLGRYGIGGGGGEGEAPAVAEETDALATLDSERVAQLEEAAKQDPDNSEVLFELGETYFQAGEWRSAIDWFTRFLALDPNNIHAQTDIGTSHFNLGEPDEAEAAWLAVLETDPNDVQAHYNLGFVYANAEPQDIPAAVKEWKIVVRLAPDSELAAIAQAHLDGMADGAGTATPPAPSEETGGGGATH